MTISPMLLQVAGIGILIVLALAMLVWVAHTALGWHGGRPVYILPNPSADREDEADDPDDPDTDVEGNDT